MNLVSSNCVNTKTPIIAGSLNQICSKSNSGKYAKYVVSVITEPITNDATN